MIIYYSIGKINLERINVVVLFVFPLMGSFCDFGFSSIMQICLTLKSCSVVSVFVKCAGCRENYVIIGWVSLLRFPIFDSSITVKSVDIQCYISI